MDSAGNVRSVEDAGTRRTRERLGQLAWLLDSSIPIPGTRFSIGLDAVIGLLPFVGDLIGVLLSGYILGEAARLGAPRAVLMRMAFNIGVEGVVGIVPLVGDVFDAAWKANQRNVRLLNDWLDRSTGIERAGGFFSTPIVLLVAALLTLLGVTVFFLVRWLIGSP